MFRDKKKTQSNIHVDEIDLAYQNTSYNVMSRCCTLTYVQRFEFGSWEGVEDHSNRAFAPLYVRLEEFNVAITLNTSYKQENTRDQLLEKVWMFTIRTWISTSQKYFLTLFTVILMALVYLHKLWDGSSYTWATAIKSWKTMNILKNQAHERRSWSNLLDALEPSVAPKSREINYAARISTGQWQEMRAARHLRRAFN